MAENYTIKIGGPTENEAFSKVTAHYKSLELQKQKRSEIAPTEGSAFESVSVKGADLPSDAIPLLKKALSR